MSSAQFIHDPLLTWRLTNAGSPAGPNFNSEREVALAGPQAARARRPSILNADVAPSEFLAAQQEAMQFNMPSHNAAAIGGILAPQNMAGNPGRTRARTNSSAAAAGIGSGSTADRTSASAPQDPAEMQNARAIEALDRVAQKLTGRDFKGDEELDVIGQVNKLIMEATKLENLCQHYIGWCSFW